MTTVTGIDVSNHQPRDLSTLIQQHQPEHVVVKLYQEVEIAGGRAHARAQIESAQAHGCTIGGYVWLYRDVPIEQQIHDALSLAEEAGVTLPILWIDYEPYVSNNNLPRISQLLEAVGVAERAGVRAGVYTGPWVWNLIGNPVTELASRPLWTADYRPLPDLNGVRLYGGWEFASGHQWTSQPVDRNVFLPEVTTVESEPEPPADDVAWMRTSLGHLAGAFADGVEAEANRKAGPRKTQVRAFAQELRRYAP